MNFKTANDVLYLLKRRIDKLIYKIDHEQKLTKDDDLREWIFHCKRELSDVHCKMHKLEDELLYDKIPFEMEFTELCKKSTQYQCSVNYIKEHFDIVSSKLGSLEIKVVGEIGTGN